MRLQTLQDGNESFNVSIHEGEQNAPNVLFAAGAGGLPERYATLLNTLCEFGCTVVAPHFERLASPSPTEAQLILRARRLSLALDELAKPGIKILGVGHSIGATMLMALAGGKMWMRSGQRVNIKTDNRISRIALLAPAVGFFQAPGALDDVRIPISVWVGSEDSMTPPSQIEWLANALSDRQTVDVHIENGAGHFSFMDIMPPQTIEPLQNKQAFLQAHSNEVFQYLVG